MSLEITTWDASIQLVDAYGNVHETESPEYDDMTEDAVREAVKEVEGELLERWNIWGAFTRVVLFGYVYDAEKGGYFEQARIQVR